MMTVNEVSKLTGVSVRTLQYYDKIGLLKPTDYTESGYRLYDDTALEKMQQILLFRELEFPLKEIKKILSRPDFDRNFSVLAICMPAAGSLRPTLTDHAERELRSLPLRQFGFTVGSDSLFYGGNLVCTGFPFFIVKMKTCKLLWLSV